MSDTDTDATVPDRAERFINRLGRAHRAKADNQLGAARRWRPGVIDPRVIALTCLDTEPADRDEYRVWAQVAKLFAIWHGGRIEPRYGSTGSGIGRWAHQLGVGDPAAERIIARITGASTPQALDGALSALAARKTAYPPHWATVLAELVAWTDPSRRDEVRFAWARDFYSFPRKTKSSNPVDSMSAR